jgi:Metallo-peptidase family M12/IPT/TIG domain
MTNAPDGVSAAELVSFDPALAPALLGVPLESRIRLEDWPVAPGRRRTLVVTRHDVYAPDARIVAVDRGREVEVPRSRLVFFWGAIEGDPESTAMIALDPDDRTISGFATGADGSFDLRPPDADRPGRHLVASAASLRPRAEERSFACGQSDLPLASEPVAPGPAPSAVEPELPTSLHTAVLAIDTDNEAMGTKFSNNTTTAANWMAAAVAGMSAVYERDVFVRFYQGHTIFRLSTTPDPYVQNAGGGADGAKLSEFSNYWAANYAGVKRTLSMMISGKQPAGGWSGIAWVGGLCSSSYGYSFNQVFRTGTSVGSSDVQLLTHEVGHNFGSSHTHCTDTNSGSAGTQPIDYCYSGESCSTGAWTPNPGQSCPASFSITPVNGGGASINNVRGTLMSYCHLLGGCGVTNVFHPSTVSVLSSRIDTAVGACIFPLGADPAPTVTGVTPASGSANGGTPVTITGTGFRNPARVAFSDLGSGPAATSVVVMNSTTITAVTPAHAPSVTDVVVMSPNQQTGVLRFAYTYSAPPTVSSISPNAGTTVGGTTVTITGANFAAPATVTIGGAPATSVNVTSGTTITAKTAVHAAGIVSVVVQTNGMTATLTNGYQYLTPPPAAGYYTLTPCRLVDTRNPNGALGGPAIPASTRRNFALTGVCGIPAGAKAISVNVAVTGPAATGFLKLFAGDGIAPLATSLNFSAGQTRGNNAIVLLATDGSGVLAVQNGSTGSLHFILDVNGYFQ